MASREAPDGRKSTGNALRDGYNVVARRPRGAAPGNIVSLECADRFERDTEMYEEYGFGSVRESRLNRITRDVEDYEEDYLDYPS